MPPVSPESMYDLSRLCFCTVISPCVIAIFQAMTVTAALLVIVEEQLIGALLIKQKYYCKKL